MAPCASAVLAKPVSDAEDLIAAANAVFGALELIAETHCGEETAQNVLEATLAANTRLEDLGITREDLRHTAFSCVPEQRERGRRPASAMVVDITSRSLGRTQ
jgi:hypothetical protein